MVFNLDITQPDGQEAGNFHIIILNDNLDKAYSELREFIAQNVDDKEQGPNETTDQ